MKIINSISTIWILWDLGSYWGPSTTSIELSQFSVVMPLFFPVTQKGFESSRKTELINLRSSSNQYLI